MQIKKRMMKRIVYIAVVLIPATKTRIQQIPIREDRSITMLFLDIQIVKSN